jgi:hypothetical protein
MVAKKSPHLWCPAKAILQGAPFRCRILGYTTLTKGIVHKHPTVQINCILRKTKR